MEWVETTGKSLDEAKEIALDRLGIGPDDAEFEILEEPRTGLFGRVRGAARVRARVKPATVRPKQDRRNRRRAEGKGRGREGSSSADTNGDRESTAESGASGRSGSADAPSGQRRRSSRRRGGGQGSGDGATTRTAPDHASSTDNTPAGGTETEDTMSDASSTHESAPVDVASVQTAAEEFTNGLLRSFGLTGTATSTVEGNEIEVRVDGQGDGLGLLIGPGGRTLLAVQDLARVAAQRRLGDHDTRLRVDVAGYREKRRVALEKFASHVADLVKESGVARSLDPMPSADRKIVHDTLSGIEGVTTRSEGEDPYRRIIVSPA